MYRIIKQYKNGKSYTTEPITSIHAVCDVALGWALDGDRIVSIQKFVDGVWMGVSSIIDELHADKFAKA